MKINVLSIDGGGIRGVGSAHMLAAFETRLGRPIHDVFQLFVGTSTGSILAAGFAAKAFTAEYVEQLYWKRGRDMFVRSGLGLSPLALFRAKYRTDRKGAVLHEILGGITLGELERNFLGTYYDIGRDPSPKFINGGPDYRRQNPPDDDYHDWPLWKVINASSSAPMYFDPALMAIGAYAGRGADGGLFANNPATCAYIEARKIFGNEAEIVMVSVGTGLSKLSYPDRKHWGMAQWASPFEHVPMMEAMFDGQASTVSYQMAHILGPQHYFRFQFSLEGYEDVTMDDASDKNQRRILSAADGCLAEPAMQATIDAAVAAVLR